MICQEFIGLLDAYVAEEVPAERRLLCEEHLVICASCTAYLATYRVTIALSRDAFPAEEAPEDWVQALLARRPR